MNVKELIKEYLSKENETLTNVINKMNLNKTDDEKTTVQNINNKLTRETIKYTEVLEIADALGYDIVWEKRKKAITQSAKSSSSGYVTKSYTAVNSGVGASVGFPFDNVVGSVIGRAFGLSWNKLKTITGLNNINEVIDDSNNDKDEMYRVDLEYDIEANIDMILDNIVLKCDDSVKDRYEDLIDSYESVKNLPISFKLTSMYRVVIKLLSVQSDSGLREFISDLRKLYSRGGLVNLNDKELRALCKISKYYIDLVNNKEID